MITIIIPTYNEDKYIEQCLDGVGKFILPKDQDIEILVIDGNSKDLTEEIVKKCQLRDSKIEILKNPNRIQSSALNIGISKAKGKWILRLDAHAFYPKNYLILCYETMLRKKVENVGGICITKPGAKTYQADLVQALCTHGFGVGDSSFRTGGKEDYVDTVPYGFFKKSLFDKIGLFDERLVRAQDYEFNKRIIESGGRIWLNPSIQVTYFNKPTITSFLSKQLFLDAPYNAYMWYLAPYSFTPRHAITSLFSLGFIGGIFLSSFNNFLKVIFIFVMIFYGILALISSVQQSIRFKNILHIFFLPPSFFLYHFLHGVGVLIGIFKLALGKAPVQNKDLVMHKNILKKK